VILGRLQVLGVQISIDDFGTGYSSLGYLQRLAVDELKIDKSFTMQLADSGDATIVRSTVDLGHNLGLRVVAEGVEDPKTAQALADIGCDTLQGYLIGRPASGAETLRLLRRNVAGAGWLPGADPHVDTHAEVLHLDATRTGAHRAASAPHLTIAEAN
jgi:diguanylate cyclase